MAILKVIGSSSKGNAYALETEEEILLLEAGCPFLAVKKAIGFDVIRVEACLVSHEHKDHAGHVKAYLGNGFPIFAPFSTAIANGDDFGEVFHVPVPQTPQRAGGFGIAAFELPHHGVENFGYIVTHKEFGTLLFLTDFEYCRYNFKGMSVNHILVEANYSKEILANNSANREHVMLGHPEINTTVEFVRTNTTDNLRNVILLHLSDGNSDEQKFIKKIKEVVPADVFVDVADAGKTFELLKEPF